MSTDPSAAALGPAEAVAGESAWPAPAAPRRELAALAVAIERLGALIALDAAPELDGTAAVERIADIAFVLHERDVEASLCDALDAAVREISDFGLRQLAGTQRMEEAAQLLRELSRRVNDLMARAQAEEGAGPPAAAQAPQRGTEGVATSNGVHLAAVDEEITKSLFAVDLDDEFARVVASLVGSLPAPSAPSNQEPAPLPPEDAVIAAQPCDRPHSSDPPDQDAGESRAAERDGVLAAAAAMEMTHAAESETDLILGEFSAEPSAAPDALTHRDGESDSQMLHQPDRQSVVEDFDPAAAIAENADEMLDPNLGPDLGPAEPAPSAAVLPEAQPAIDPGEDPGELFEPAFQPIAATRTAPPPEVSPEMPTPVGAPPAPINCRARVEKTTPPQPDSEEKLVPSAQPAAQPSASLAGAASSAAKPDEKPQVKLAPLGADSVSPPASRSATADPLAPVRALSEEEMIALFS